MRRNAHVTVTVSALCLAGCAAALAASGEAPVAVGVLGKGALALSEAFRVAGEGWPQALCASGLCVAGTLVPDLDQRVCFLEHRTWTHSALFVGALVAWGLLWAPAFWVGAGAFLHVLADSFSVCGVAWAYPWVGYRRYQGGAKVKKGVHLFPLYRDSGRSQCYAAGAMAGVAAVSCVACAPQLLALLAG